MELTRIYVPRRYFTVCVYFYSFRHYCNCIHDTLVQLPRVFTIILVFQWLYSHLQWMAGQNRLYMRELPVEIAFERILCNLEFRLMQIFCIHSVTFKLIPASFTEKSSVKCTLLTILCIHVVWEKVPTVSRLDAKQPFLLPFKEVPIMELWLLQRISGNNMMVSSHSWFRCQRLRVPSG